MARNQKPDPAVEMAHSLAMVVSTCFQRLKNPLSDPKDTSVYEQIIDLALGQIETEEARCIFIDLLRGHLGDHYASNAPICF